MKLATATVAQQSHAVQHVPQRSTGTMAAMPGHGVVADHRTGQIYSGYHTENFVEIPEDEA